MNEKPVVAGIGELLWDILPSGRQLGGAPCNFVFHAIQAGSKGFMVSSVGDDESGVELNNVITKLGLSNQYLQKNEHPTSTVTVELDNNGYPAYHILENVAWDYLQWDKSLEQLASVLDAVCFGTLAQRSLQSELTIKSFIEATNSKCLKVFDINLRQDYYSKDIISTSLILSDVLKLNEDELSVITSCFGIRGTVDEQLKQILKNFALKYVVYTMGSRGSIIFSETERSIISAPDVEVIDTVGAGDAFTATFVTGILKGISLKRVHEKANQVAAYVCTQKGATPKQTGKVF